MPVNHLAAQTGGVLSVAGAARQAGVEPSTAESYTKLLEAAFLIHRLPAWGRTLRARVTATPKVHLVDAGLAARLLHLTPEKLGRRQPAALTELGHLLETFVVNELLKQASVPGGDLTGLRMLRDTVGDGFLGGVVLYLGQRSYTFEDRLHVVPVDRLWAP